MALTRRGFLGTLLAPLAIKPAAEGWRLFVSAGPSAFGFAPALSLDEINAVTAREILPAVVDDYFKLTPLLTYFKEGR